MIATNHIHTQTHKEERWELANYGDGIIDLIPTRLIKIPLSDQERADHAYYQALGDYLSENSRGDQ